MFEEMEPLPVTTSEGHYRRFGIHRIRRGWLSWRRSRPFWGGLLAILGGLLMVYGPVTAYRFVFASPNTVGLGIVVGALVIALGLFFWFAPSQRQLIGVFIVALSLLSFVTSDMGGFVVGMILGLVGGSLGFAWMPVEVWKPRPWHRQARREWKEWKQEHQAGRTSRPALGSEAAGEADR